MTLVRVPVANTVGKTVRIDTAASPGATIGTDLRLPDGTVPSLTELATALAISSTQTGTQRSDAYIYWNQILGDYDHIQFDVTAACATAEGKLCWNTEDGTLQVGMPGGDVNLQIGQEHLIRCRNTTGVTIPNGSVVRITGASGNKPLIDLADASALATANVLGFSTEEILHNANGYVTTTGLVRDVNTLGMTAGNLVYLSETAGEFTETKPTPPAIRAHIGHVVSVNETTGVVLALMEDAVEFVDLAGVEVNSLSQDDMLYYDGTNITDTGGKVTWSGTNFHVDGTAEVTGTLTVSGALTALSYGGITEANLVDKSAAESIPGVWAFTGGNLGTSAGSVYAMGDAGNPPSGVNIRMAVSGAEGFLDARDFVGGTWEPMNLRGSSFTFLEGNIVAGTIDADFDALTATSYGGITEANLVDKSAAETIAGVWDHTADITLGTNLAQTNQLIKTFSPTHEADNVPAEVALLLNDGSPSGVRIKNTRSGSFNSQAIHFDVHEGGVAVRADAMVINKTGRVDIATALKLISTSAFVSGDGPKFYKQVTNGAAIQGVTGSVYDLTLQTPIGQLILANPTGTNDATFVGNILALSYGGITEANLLDKTATETITGNWLFSSTAPTIEFIETGVTAENGRWMFRAQAEQLVFATRTDAGGAGANWLTVDRVGTVIDGMTFTPGGGDFTVTTASSKSLRLLGGGSLEIFDAGSTDKVSMSHDGTDFLSVYTNTDDVKFSGAAVQYDFDNDVVITGPLTATTIGGITEANLVDKTATESITGAWTFDGQPIVLDNGSWLKVLDSTTTDFVELIEVGTLARLQSNNNPIQIRPQATAAMDFSSTLITGYVPVTAPYFQMPRYTTAQLEDVTHAVNTSDGKVDGAAVWNLTTNKPVWANGSADADVWLDHAAGTAHTPV